MKKWAEYFVVAYCGGCPGAHLQLCNQAGKIFAEAVINSEMAEAIIKELMYYRENGPRKEGKNFTMPDPNGIRPH